jgi:alpha-ketoglutarate-dependent taurine dioxygenase
MDALRISVSLAVVGPANATANASFTSSVEADSFTFNEESFHTTVPRIVPFPGRWHSDTAYLGQPPLATLLYAVETPSHGGDTLFASTRAAYDALSEGMRRLVDALVGVNDAGLKHGGGFASRT